MPTKPEEIARIAGIIRGIRALRRSLFCLIALLCCGIPIWAAPGATQGAGPGDSGGTASARTLPLVLLVAGQQNTASKADLGKVLSRVSELARAQFGSEFSVLLSDDSKNPTTLQARCGIIESGAYSSVSLELVGGPKSLPPALSTIGADREQQAWALLGLLSSQVARLGSDAGAAVRSPELINEVSLQGIKASSSALPGSIQLEGGAISADSSDGGVVVSELSGAFLVDRFGRVLMWYGQQLAEHGSYFSYLSLSSSPAGTVWMSDTTSKTLYKFPEKSDESQSFALNTSSGSYFAALNDGSGIVHDASGKFLRWNEGKGTDISLEGMDPQASRNLFGWTVGPDNTIAAWDPVARCVRFFSVSGQFLGLMFPRFDGDPSDSSLGPNGTVVLLRRDGSVILSTSRGFDSYAQNGKHLWSLDLGSFGYSVAGFRNSVAVDEVHGWLWVNASRLLRFRLPDAQMGPSDALDDALVALQKSTSSKGRDLALATLYDKNNLEESAFDAWSSVVASDPMNTIAKNRIRSLTQVLDRRKIELDEAHVRELLKRFGQETARPVYQNTMKLYEEDVARNPEDQEMKDRMRALAKAFADADILKLAPAGVELTSREIPSVFPTLGEQYRSHGLGSITIRNTGSDPITRVRSSFYLPKYMDFPGLSSESPAIASGASGDLTVFAPLNTSALDLSEPLNLQAELSVDYFRGGNEEKQTWYIPVRLNQRNALTWDDSAKIGSFITPNESTVSTFAHRILASYRGASVAANLPEKVRQAFMIVEALGAYGIQYVQDPASPFDQLMGNADLVDTVRFARQTLELRGGDCDDTTALLASCLESIGVRTAIMTSPGHIFLAFCTEEPGTRAWLYSSGTCTPIVKGDLVWIPIETTTFSQGFAASWQSASALIARYKASDIEFIPVNAAQAKYPPMSLSGSSSLVSEPPESVLALSLDRGFSELRAVAYQPIATRLQADLSPGNANFVRSGNQLGILNASYDRLDDAIKVFQRLAATNESSSISTNYAHALLLSGRLKEAESVLSAAAVKYPGSAQISYMLARIYVETNRPDLGRSQWVALQKLDAPLAGELAGVFSGASGAQRGADAKAPPADWFDQ